MLSLRHYLRPYKTIRTLLKLVDVLPTANDTARRGVELSHRWEALCDRQAKQIEELTFKNECLMRGIDPLVTNRSTDHFELKPLKCVN